MPAIGDLVASDRGWVMTLAPTHCPNGHRVGAYQVLVGHAACLAHRGHTTWTCQQCGAIAYGPDVGQACSMPNGPAAVRSSFRPSSS